MRAVKTSKAVAASASTTRVLRTGAMETVRFMRLEPLAVFLAGPGDTHGFGFEIDERLAPELVEPGAQRPKPVRIDVVHAAGPLGPVDDQAGVLQHLEMLRYRRPAHRHLL